MSWVEPSAQSVGPAARYSPGSVTTSPRAGIRPTRSAPTTASAHARSTLGARRMDQISSPLASSNRGTAIPTSADSAS